VGVPKNCEKKNFCHVTRAQNICTRVLKAG